MNPHTNDIDAHLADLLDLPSPQRDQVLARLAISDEARREIAALLRAHEQAGDFLAEPAFAPPSDTSASSAVYAVSDAPSQLGPYRLLRELGVGGMGAVHLAERTIAGATQRVALKLLRGDVASADALRRFDHERRTLASLEHPAIARLLDGGEIDRRPYIAMEYVDGQPIDAYARSRRLDVSARLRLFRDVCAAVQFAHQNLVVHRDLKPSNILVTRDGRVKLLDFGIAKLLDDGAALDASSRFAMTRTGQMVLTPRYASPEQVTSDRITTASDVYSLGVVLYELLTGRPPYELKSGTAHEMQRVVCHAQPDPPSSVIRASTTSSAQLATFGADSRRLGRRLAGDLDLIVLKALRKAPERRYASVEQFADDIQRQLRGLPVHARPESLLYTWRKYAQRHAVALSAAAAVFLALVLGVIGTSIGLTRANAAAQEAARQRTAASETAGFLRSILTSLTPEEAQGRDTTLLRELIDEAAPRIDAEFANTPETAASLHMTLAQTYAAIAEYAAAQHHAERAVALFAETPASETQMLNDATALLARIHFERGDYRAAAALQQDLLAVYTAQRPPRPAALAETQRQLGLILTALGDYPAGERWLRDAVASGRRSADARVLGRALIDLGRNLTDTRALDEAATVLGEALTTLRDTYGDTDDDVGDAHQALAWLHRRSGNPQDAEPHARAALDVMIATRGEDHPFTATKREALAGVLEELGQFDKAELRYRVALPVFERVYGREHRATGTTLNNIANLYRKTHRYAEAAPLYRDAIRVYQAALGDDHIWLSIPRSGLARVSEQLGLWEEMEAQAEECVRLVTLIDKPESLDMAVAESLLGGAWLGQQRYDDALPLLIRSAEQTLQHAAPQSAVARAAIERVVRCYEAVGDAAAADAWRARLTGH